MILNKILKIGHRGAKGHVAENTLESIQKAIELGADGVEIDVHLCQTGELVVFHDFNLERMTNGKGEIRLKSLQALKQLKVDGQFEIPTLLEVLELIGKKCFLNIELKGGQTASPTCSYIQAYVKKGWSYAHFLVSSFDYNALREVYSLDKDIPLAVLTETDIEAALDCAKTIKAKAIHPDYRLVDAPLVARLQKMGYKVNVWTVNSLETIERMKLYGVNGIISDFPDRL